MQVHYSNHAKDMMALRNVSEKQVEICINNYQTMYHDEKGHRVYGHKFEDGRNIRVIVDASKWLVITVKD